jgi:hypothetical protein
MAASEPREPEIISHLDSLTSFTPYEVTAKDERALVMDRESWIVRKLLRKPFRRGPLHPDAMEDVRLKVRRSLSDSEPIYLIICFGGYKHFWNSSHPYVDYAELFNLSFMTRFLAPILAVHEPGAILDYESEDLVLPLIDNYPPGALEKYASSFRALVEQYTSRTTLPTNLTIRLMRPQDEDPFKSHGYAVKLFERIDDLRGAKEEEWAALSENDRAERLHRTPRSIMWNGREDLTGLSDDERLQRMIRSKVLNETYYDADFEFREEYLTGGTHIPFVLTWGRSSENVGNWITLASTDSSTVDFWIGRGILDHQGSRLINRIVSRTQYESARCEITSYPGLDWGDLPELANLRSIDVRQVTD